MFKTMLKPFFKRFIGLFISMVFVSMLSSGLLVSFTSAMTNLKSSYKGYKEDYGSVDALVTTDFTARSVYEGVDQYEEIDAYDGRFIFDANLKVKESEEKERTLTTRVLSYNPEQNHVFKRYIIEDGGYDATKKNVSIVRKFAKNNNIKVGDTIKVGFATFYINLNVEAIVETPESLNTRANDYIWSDNVDFGYIYASEQEIDKVFKDFLEGLKNDDDLRNIYETLRSSIGMTLPSYDDLIIMGESSEYASKFANQLLIKANKKYSQQEALDKALEFLQGKVNVKSSSAGSQLFYEVYMKNAMNQLTVAATFLPIFFYLVTMVVIVLFLNQIITAMTQDIGIMMSIGISGKEILGIFCLFSLIMTIVASILGMGVGFGLNWYLASKFIAAYSIPTISYFLNPWICAISAVALIVVGQIATLISSTRIFKITPKDAMISNESKRKKLPKAMQKVIDKSPMNTKLSLNSVMQNPRRFFVSTFSIFAALTMILVTGFFYVSKNTMLGQTLNQRMNYDCQVYLTEKDTSNFINNLKEQEFVTEAEECYYTYLEVNVNGADYYLECLGADEGDHELIYIPDASGKKSLEIPHEGIVLTQNDAKRLNVKVGDTITVNGKAIEIKAISKQYFHFTQYMSKEYMDSLSVECVTSYLVDFTNKELFASYLSDNKTASLAVYTNSLKADLNSIFSAVDIFIAILIAFSLGMGFVILTIMSQNTMMEQRRPISVMRAIGFRMINISNIWTFTSFLHTLFACIFAIPTGIGVSALLFKLASSKNQIYPMILDWRVILMAIGFVLIVIIASHLLSMLSIRKWNLADNTRSRE